MGNSHLFPDLKFRKLSVLLSAFIQLFFLQMMKFAWDNYKQYALGKNELRPVTKNGHIGNMFGEFWINFSAILLYFFLRSHVHISSFICSAARYLEQLWSLSSSHFYEVRLLIQLLGVTYPYPIAGNLIPTGISQRPACITSVYRFSTNHVWEQC